MRVIFFALVLSLVNVVNSQQSSCEISAANSNTLQGVLIPNNTVASCSAAYFKQRAVNDTYKYGFDFNNGDNTCWFSTSSTTRSAPGIDHYTCYLIPVIGEGTCNYSIDDVNTKDGIVQPVANSLAECTTACLSNPICTKGFDWVESAAIGLKCFFSTTLATQTATGVRHYYCIPAPNTTPAPPTLPPNIMRCQNFSNSNSPNGVATPVTVNTPDLCKSACFLVNGCIYGFDFNWNDKRCWVNTNPTVINGTLGVDHFICVQSTTINSGVNAGCAWTEAINTNTKGGVGQATLTTVDQCKTTCLATPSCLANGFDWDPAGTPKCWFSTTPTTQTATGVSHFMCQAGMSAATTVASTVKTELCQWSSNINKGSPGGTLLSNATTLDACKASCKTITLCLLYGFDWNPQNPIGSQCFISNSVFQTDSIGVTHYFWNCTGCSFIKYIDTNSPGGIKVPAQTVDECQSRCLMNSSCWQFGFDFDENNLFGEKCWLSNSTSTAFAKNISHYLPTCFLGNNSTTPSSGATNCAWNLVLDKHTLGGILITNATTLAICQDVCKALPTCNTLGIDWDVSQAPGKQCYVAVAPDLYDLKNVAHYTYTCQATPSATGSGDICSWTSKPNFQTIGGIKNSASTIAQCQAECLKSPTCSLNGIDFVPGAPAGSQCWVSTSSEIYSIIGVNHYSYACISTACLPSCDTGANSPGGILKPEAITESDCQKLCLQFRTRCISYGYDWVINGVVGSQCWLSTSNDISLSDSVKHCGFDLSCLNPEASPSPCIWDVLDDKNSPGGVLNPATTLDSCKSACLSSTSCRQYGFDYTTDNKCWLSTSGASGNLKYVKHYSYKCAMTGPETTTTTMIPSTKSVALCDWKNLTNINSPGGTFVASATDIQSCKDACTRDAERCSRFGFDWDTNSNTCYLSTSTITLITQFVNHYNYICGSNCSWKMLNDVNSPGGILQRSVSTLGQCQSLCTQSGTNCAYGFDWDSKAPQGGQCWFSTSTATGTFVGVTHYVCENTTTTTTTTTPTVAPLTTKCGWNDYPGKALLLNGSYPGYPGDPKTALQFPIDCRNMCVATTSCQAYAWSPNNPFSKCWFYYTKTFPNSNSTDTAAVHYIYFC